MKTYTATGHVWGNLWGGGSCGYEARTIHGNTLDDVLAEARKALDNGSLDSGMGYERLTGALLSVCETDTQVIDGKTYTHDEYTSYVLGKLTDEQYELLLSA